MVTCPKCQVHNSLDSHFCKGCGESLPQDAVAEAQRDHEQLVAEGYKALNEARVEEALLIAITALEQFPESISALSLKGMALERQGALAESLETYEKVLALNPNSALDKIKVQQLRNSMSAKLLSSDNPTPNKKVAVFAAVAAVVLVGAIGVIAANFSSNKPSGSSVDNSNMVGQMNPNVANPNKNTNQGNQGTIDPNSASTKTGNPNNDPNYEKPIGTNGAQSNGGGIKLPPASGMRLPGAGGGPDLGPINPGGIVIQPEGGSNQTGNVGNSTGSKPTVPDEGPDPTVGENKKPPETDPKDNPGEIEIKTSRTPGTGNRNGGSEVGDGGMGMKALQAAAQQQFQLGKYDQAAKSYEKLLGMGADPGRTNQRLGQCYQNMGQNAAAADAYRRAIAAFDSRIKNSSGDTSGLQNALASCRAALKVVG